jgi:hypothetical protein
MWFGKQFYCLAAFMFTELSAMALFIFSVLAQVTPDAMHGALTPKAMVIGAYTAMIGVIIGGVIQVMQLVVNSKATKLEGAIRERDIQSEAEKKTREAIDSARAKELELVKAQAEILRQNMVWLQGWQTTMLNQKPGEDYGTSPTFHPDPTTSTPQAMEQSRTLPLVSNPVLDSVVPPLVPIPPGITKVSPSSSGIFPADGTKDAVKENTEALQENTEAIKEATKDV